MTENVDLVYWENTCEQLRSENARLREQVASLKSQVKGWRFAVAYWQQKAWRSIGRKTVGLPRRRVHQEL